MRTSAVVAMLVLLVAGLQAPTSAQFQPTTGPDVDGLVAREDVATAGELEGAKRVLRFVQVSDAHILDDEAPHPMRVEAIDPLGDPVDGAQRPHDEYTDEVLDAMIRMINSIHAQDALDFVINTGDNIDNELENELMRFIDNWEGTYTTTGPVSGLECVPDGQSADINDDSTDSTDACTALPESFATQNTPLAADLPWFSAFGNHDGLIQGNVPIEPSFNEAAAQFGRTFLTQQEYVRMHFAAGVACADGAPTGRAIDDFGHGYGFAGSRLCDDNPDNDGYYAYVLNGIRFVVLDTVNDDFFAANEHTQPRVPAEPGGYDVFGGYNQGSIDPEQFAWLQDQIDDNPDDLIVVLSHHTLNSMFLEPASSQCDGDGNCLRDLLEAAGYRTHDALLELMASSPNVAGWIGGHTHKHRIQAKSFDGAASSFWNIETSSLIDMPQEARVVEMWVTANGTKGFWLLRTVAHDDEEHRAVAAADPQRGAGEGLPEDQDVLLWFDIPAAVKVSPQPSLARFTALTLDSPKPVDGVHGHAGDVLELRLNVTDGRFGGPVSGLSARAVVTHRAPLEPDTLLTDYDGPLQDLGTGQYVANFTAPDPATYFVQVSVVDPANLYPDNGRVISLRIDGDVPLPADKKSPGLGALALLGALAIALASRRQNR